MNQLAPNINRGPQVGWGSLLGSFYGQAALGFTALKYGSKQKKELVYGAGNYPQGTGYGNVEYTGELEMYRWQANAILLAVQAAGGNSLEDAPASPLTVIYSTAPVGGTETYTDVLTYEFMETNVDLKQGDIMSKVKVPILITGIKWGAGI